MIDNKKVRRSASDRRKELRDALWPGLDDNQLWLRRQRTGFTTIPRTIVLVGLMIDQMSGKGFPLASTYLTLWCWVFDEGLVEIRNPRELAFESGFTGPRAETTWRARMRRLVDIGFIRAKPGLLGEFQYVLILNPLRVVKAAYVDRSKDGLYNALLSRANSVGADDFDQ